MNQINSLKMKSNLQRKFGYSFRLLTIVALVIASFVSTPAINVKAGSTGTSDGVYDFSGPLGDIDSETGLVEFGDKFLISDGFEVDGTQLYSLNGEAGATETLIIKAEGGDICKTFTFKDLGISLYTGISSTEITLTLVIKNAYGETIGTHTTSNGKKIAGDGSDKVVYQLSNLLDHDGQFNYNGVASLEITYQLGKDYYNTIRLPMDLNFENITIANVSADDIPPFIPDGVINATNVSTSGVTLDWSKATDNITSQEELEYQIYQSSSDNIDTISNIEENGTPLSSGFTKDVESYNVTGLSPGTTYYFNVIVKDKTGNKSSYTMKQVTTASPVTAPTVTTNTASNVTSTSATVGGDVTSDGGATITKRGVVYATSANPTTNDSIEIVPGTTGDFTTNLSNLIPNTTYHYRAYATNSEGTGYGSDQTFTTASLSSNADLSNLTLSSGTLSPEFASGTTEYTANVANGITNITVTPTVADSTATIKVNGTTVTSGQASENITLAVGSNEITMVVTAQNGDTKTYKITVTRAASSNAGLSNLTLSSGTLSPEFTSGTTEYTASVANGITNITVTPTVADSTATIKVNGTTVTSGQASEDITLAVGSNEITMVVTAEDTSTKTYKVTVTRAASSNADLSNLTLSSGTLSPEFTSGTTEYTANVANSVTNITVTPTVADSTATVKVNGTTVTSGQASEDITLAVGSNEITMVVTAEDTSTKTYKITVTRAASSNADLSNLTLSSGTLSPEFASGTTEYTASVANSVTNITVTPTVADSTATIKVNGTTVTSGQASADIALTVGTNEITMVVTAQNGDTKTYKITVTRAASSNADLSNLTLSSGTLSPEFTSGTTEYTANVANSITNITVTPTVAENNATVTVNGTPVTTGEASADISLTVGSNEITMVVTAQNGDTKTYKITVTRAASSNADLSNLTLSSGTLSPEFTSGTTEYTANVANGITNITVTPTVAENNTTVTVNGTPVTTGEASADIPLNVGVNEITIIVTAQNGITKTYTVNITRATPKTYTVSYDGNGATIGTVPKDGHTYLESSKVIVLDNTGKLMKPGYKFSGWNTKADGTGTTYLPNDTFTIGNENITLYAKWTKNGNSSSKPGGSSSSSSSGTKRPADIGSGAGNLSYAQVDIVRTIKGNKKIDQVELDKTTLSKALMGALEQKQDFISIRISDLPNDPADEVVVTLPKEPLSQLSTSHSALEIKTEDVSIWLPKESTQDLSGKNELFFRIVPIREQTEQQDIFEHTLKAKVVKEIAGDREVKVLGKPMTIETNYQNLNTTVTFSLKDLPLPNNQLEREEFLKSLAIFIEHSDGEEVVQRGKIKYDATGEPVGLEIEISKFSTFTMIGLPESDFDGQKMEAPHKVMPDKVWTITFNNSINPSTVSNNSIYVKDIYGNKVDVNVKQVNTKTIQVIPADVYQSNETYYLYITKEILSTTGKSLSEAYRMTFTINQSVEGEE